ncbi:MAG: hypothetical protein EAZ97_03880 [Bacteroidetes bacterium]|nr:MAG: hypothetical protein EAZ97_03880 [Bacteroidota bacterium]
MIPFISQAFVQAMGWTILHSLWQIALIAIILAVLMLVLHKHSSQTRYFTAMIAMFSALILSCLTFANLYESAEQQQIFANQNTLSNNVSVVYQASFSQESEPQMIDFGSYFEKHLPLIVTIWLLGILVLSLRFMGAWAYVQRLKSYKTISLATLWQDKIDELAYKLQINTKVGILESALVNVPMAIGYFKPVVLLPMGLITGLSAQQIESILAHELAHIRRNDYLINIFQSLIEITFFFHPAIWWISRLISEERENCCDDLAVSVCGDSLTFAKALTNLEQMNLQTPRFAMAISGKDGKLLNRIKRMLLGTSKQKNATFSEGFTAGCLMIIGLLAMSLVANANFSEWKNENLNVFEDKIQENNQKKTNEILEILEDESLEADILTLEDSTGKKKSLVIVKNKKGKITQLFVNGQKVSGSDIDQYRDLIEEKTGKNDQKMTKIEIEQSIKESLAEVEDAEDKLSNFDFNFNFDSTNFNFEMPDIAPPVPPVRHGFVEIDSENGDHFIYHFNSDSLRDVSKKIKNSVKIFTNDSLGKKIVIRMNNRFGEEETEVELKNLDKHFQKQQEQFEKDQKNFEKEQRSFEKQMDKFGKKQDSIMKIQHIKMIKNHEKMAERHEKLAQMHEKNAQKHEKNAQEQEEKFTKMREELKKDGLISDSKNVKIKLTDKIMEVNDQAVSEEVRQKYANFLAPEAIKDGKPFNIDINVKE